MNCTYHIFLCVLLFTSVSQLLMAGERVNGESAPRMYQLPNTRVDSFASVINGQEYILYTGLPPNYENTSQSYPLIVTLDADYAFAVAHNIVRHLADRHDLPLAVIVSVAYPGASEDMTVYRTHRTREYTPTHTLEGGYGPEFQAVSGGGGLFLRMLSEELLPMIESKYRIQRDNKVLVGHSFGGLFTACALFADKPVFEKYLLVSPSLWYDNQVIFSMEEKFAGTHTALPADVYLSVSTDEQHHMEVELMRFKEVLASRSYNGLTVHLEIIPGENHNTIFPIALTRGLRILLNP